MTDNQIEKPSKEPDKEEIDFRKLMEFVREAAPHLADGMAKKAEQETIRHKNALRFWSLPFLVSIVLLGGGVLVLAGMAIQRDKADVALTIVGYLMTFLGGVGTGQSMKSKANP